MHLRKFHILVIMDRRSDNQAGYIGGLPKTLAHAPDILDIREFIKLEQRFRGERRKNAD
ncbi:hypothetical protein [Ochrobactrum soli]|uniref:hypothetical protein n=1 Tax=Ochrobactrum soli TaxID=2448455 RepID=UPI0015E82473|nr:hypothetical protein [[Ochrobactrum] soli]